MYADETPTLEAVFVSLAPSAVSITDIFAEGLFDWYTTPLTYRELLEWVEEQM